MNQPNNEGQPSAEAGEGRAQIEENTVQSHMRPTQSGKRTSQGLRGVRQAAKERKQERFTALEFGRFAARDRKERGEGKPETFTFFPPLRASICLEGL